MFELERFIENCRSARAEDETHKAVREVVAKAKDPGERRRLEVACIEMTRAMDKQG